MEIVYRTSLAYLTGDLTSAVILSYLMMEWFNIYNKEPFEETFERLSEISLLSKDAVKVQLLKMEESKILDLDILNDETFVVQLNWENIEKSLEKINNFLNDGK